VPVKLSVTAGLLQRPPAQERKEKGTGKKKKKGGKGAHKRF